MKLVIIFTFFLFFLTISSNAQLPNITLTEVTSGLTEPLFVTHCNDDRIFIVEQPGRIAVMHQDSSSYTTFLDITSIVNDAASEQGLLGLAFHPDYQNNGYFYVNYIAGSGTGESVVERYTVSSDPNIADAASGVTLFTVEQPYANHNGGCMQFGPDGYLYIAFGDGGSANDPPGNGQNLATRLGKMLRIDVNNPNAPYYSVPPTNPFYNNPNADSTIWSYGLRNPWRFSFDRVTGDMWIGDVGQGAWEEIDFEAAGDTGGYNYGWDCWEGFHHAAGWGSSCPADSIVTFPVYEYPQSSDDCSVTGGYVYRGADINLLYGKYVFADYCASDIRILYDSAGVWNNAQLNDGPNFQISSFGEDRCGELYVCYLGWGTIYKITSPDCAPVAEILSDEVISFCSDSAVTLAVLQGCQNYSYQWKKNALVMLNDTAPEVIVADSGFYSIVVSNDQGCSTESDSVQVITTLLPQLQFIDLSDTVCYLGIGGWIELEALPIGGTFSSSSGTLNDSLFTPELGLNIIYYSYTDSNSCITTIADSLTAVICDGVDDLNKNTINIYPNPVTDEFAIELHNNTNDLVGDVFDVSGKLIQSFVIPKLATTYRHSISELSNGVYVLRLSDVNNVSFVKLVKASE